MIDNGDGDDRDGDGHGDGHGHGHGHGHGDFLHSSIIFPMGMDSANFDPRSFIDELLKSEENQSSESPALDLLALGTSQQPSSPSPSPSPSSPNKNGSLAQPHAATGKAILQLPFQCHGSQCFLK